MKNPFSLIDDNSLQPSKIQNKMVQHPRSSIIKSSQLPFKPFQIKYQPKKKIQEKIIKSPRINNQLKKQQQNQNNKQKNQKQIINNSQNKAQSKPQNPSQQSEEVFYQQQDQSQQKQYFLSKKNRIVQYKLDQHGDPPLLYDIGLQTQMIKDKIKLVLTVGQPDYDMIRNPDLSGPIIIAFAFGFLLLLSGQLRFADIYAIFIFGNAFLFFFFNFMKKDGMISLYNIMSILGYSLLPMLILGVLKIFMKLNSPKGIFLSLSVALWSSAASGKFIQALIKGKKNKKMLIAYPLLLFYLSFSMIVIF